MLGRASKAVYSQNTTIFLACLSAVTKFSPRLLKDDRTILLTVYFFESFWHQVLGSNQCHTSTLLGCLNMVPAAKIRQISFPCL